MHQLMASVFRGMENAHKFGAGTNDEGSSYSAHSRWSDKVDQ